MHPESQPTIHLVTKSISLISQTLIYNTLYLLEKSFRPNNYVITCYTDTDSDTNNHVQKLFTTV